MHFLTMVNRILQRLREDQVGAITENDYAQLIGQFINDAKADLEDINHTWSAYEQVIDLSILDDGTREYDLSATNDRSFLLRDGDYDQIPLAYDITATEKGQLYDCPLKDIHRERGLTNNIVDVERPKVFAVKQDTDVMEGYKIELLWGSTTPRTWRMYWYVPQEDFALDGTDDNTYIALPSRPIFLRALFYALTERGEELGGNPEISWQRSQESIAAALETDMQVQKKSEEIDITNKEMI